MGICFATIIKLFKDSKKEIKLEEDDSSFHQHLINDEQINQDQKENQFNYSQSQTQFPKTIKIADSSLIQQLDVIQCQIDLKNSQKVFLSQPQDKLDLSHFQILKVLGRGSFGKVMLVEYKKTNQLYAMKVLRKDLISIRNQEIHVRAEKTILQTLSHPFLVQLHYAFQSTTKLYMVLDFIIGGELFVHLRRSYRFSEERAKFYAAELILALKFLHENGIVYRDLKPENILLDEFGHIKLTDFGLSKLNVEQGDKTYTLCGTPEYVAPEILLKQGHNQCVDWFSLVTDVIKLFMKGILIYEMLAGKPPFYSKDKKEMIANRLTNEIEFPSYFSPTVCNLLQGLLQKDPNNRLGNCGSKEIIKHEFFEGIDWKKLLKKQTIVPFIPVVQHKYDLSNFDETFTNQDIKDTPIIDFDQIKNYDQFSYQKKDEAHVSLQKKFTVNTESTREQLISKESIS